MFQLVPGTQVDSNDTENDECHVSEQAFPALDEHHPIRRDKSDF
jgi:hypothetical protein